MYAQNALVENVTCTFKEKKSVVFVGISLKKQGSFRFSEKVLANELNEKCIYFYSYKGKYINVYDRYGYVIAIESALGELINDPDKRIWSYNMTLIIIFFLPLSIIWRISYQIIQRLNKGYKGLELIFMKQ